jgi:hypothetical protein
LTTCKTCALWGETESGEYGSCCRLSDEDGWLTIGDGTIYTLPDFGCNEHAPRGERPTEVDNLDGTKMVVCNGEITRVSTGDVAGFLERFIALFEDHSYSEYGALVLEAKGLLARHGEPLILEGPLRWAYHEGWSIGSSNVLDAIWARWSETYHSEGPHGSFRVIIERLE